ncbi:hypothetical protein D3C76_1457080 [compost metagenome]
MKRAFIGFKHIRICRIEREKGASILHNYARISWNVGCAKIKVQTLNKRDGVAFLIDYSSVGCILPDRFGQEGLCY